MLWPGRLLPTSSSLLSPNSLRHRSHRVRGKVASPSGDESCGQPALVGQAKQLQDSPAAAAARAHHPQPDPAFVFAEMQHTDYTPAGWGPKFADYLSLSFWTATAFSPTDVSAIKRWAKLMMITEAAASLVIGILVIARAVNILK